ncbi:CIS tube protein [Zooshikella sp. RANM57]|uniref:CIS tube protein n=1 Tax=Zooshikella sp. RANM57 TaxID=3425863 RepID=UPI003D6E9B00
MTLSLSLKKEKLKIIACNLNNGELSKSETSFEVMINPDSINHEYKINYTSNDSHKRVQGAIAPEVKFAGYEAEELSFDLVLDGTGVVTKGLSAILTSGLTSKVTKQLMALKKILYEYNGKEHTPNIVEVNWGDIAFIGRLSKLSVNYTLFKPNGAPLRAKVGLAFSGYISNDEAEKLANKSSPDLTHMVVVKAGDTLPLLCHQIYKNCNYYPQVARFNQLKSCTRLQPGTSLYFPPIDNE